MGVTDPQRERSTMTDPDETVQDEAPIELAEPISRAREAARSLRARPGYRLIEESELAERIAARLRLADSAAPALATRLAQTIYAEALYQACGAKDSFLQDRAYEELGDYLYRVAYNLVRGRGGPIDLAEEATQEALIKIHGALSSVAHPGAFLAFSLKTLCRECGPLLKVAIDQGRCVPLDPALDLPDRKVAPPVILELRDCLVAAIGRLPNPDWQAIITLQHFVGADDGEIAATLGKRRANVQVMRHRALLHLRNDIELAQCLQR